MNAVARRASNAARALSAFALTALTACSSVSSVNDQAMLVGPEDSSRHRPAEPFQLMRPARTEYRIGPKDLLEIDVYELEEPYKTKQLRSRVALDGTVLVPLIGSVEVAGHTAPEVQAEIARRLGADFLVNPTVNVVVAEHQARRITVLGAVQSPGTFHLDENSTTLVDALALAGGPTEKAGSAVYVVREHGMADGVALADASSGAVTTAATNPRLVKVDLIDLVERGNLAANCVLDDGDVVHVPPAAQFFVMGEVNEGGAFPLRGEITLLRAIAMAGGLRDKATPAATILIRTTEKGRVTMPIDLSQVQAGSTKDFLMQADDVLVVNESGGDAFARGVGSFLRGIFHVNYGL